MVGFGPPAFGECAAVDGVVADRGEERGHGGLGADVVAEDRQGGAAGALAGLGQVQQMPGVDVVERLDDMGLRCVALEQAAAGELAGVQFGDMAVALGVVVVGVDHCFAGHGSGGHRGDGV